MKFKTLVIACFLAGAGASAQDISTLKNTLEVYSNPDVNTSARLESMAGAHGATGGEAGSMISNPAGLGVAIASVVSTNIHFDNYDNASAFGGVYRSYQNNKTALGNISGLFSYKLDDRTPWKFVNVAINVSNQSLDNYLETVGGSLSFSKQLINSQNQPVVGELALKRHAYDRTGNLTTTSVGVGGNYNDKLYIGAALHLQNSDLEQYDTAQFQLDLDGSTNSFYKQYTPFGERATGAGVSLGVIGKLYKNVRLGATVQSPMYMMVQRTYTDYFTNDSGYISSEQLDEDRSFHSPWKAGVSLGLVQGKNFSANVDYKATLGKPQYTTSGAANDELNEFFNKYYQAQHEVAVGAEYRMNRFRVRAGYGFQSNPLKQIAIEEMVSNAASAKSTSYDDLITGKRHAASVGIGYDWNSFFIDLAYRHASMQYTSPFLYGETNGNYSTGYHNNDYDVATAAFATSKVDRKSNTFSVGFGWKF